MNGRKNMEKEVMTVKQGNAYIEIDIRNMDVHDYLEGVVATMKALWYQLGSIENGLDNALEAIKEEIAVTRTET